jgi:hypothetical protein
VKKSSDTGASLEAHRPTISSDDVYVNTGIFISIFACWYSRAIFGQNLMKKFVVLGNECVEYLKAAKASEGNFLSYTCLSCMPFFA